MCDLSLGSNATRARSRVHLSGDSRWLPKRGDPERDLEVLCQVPGQLPPPRPTPQTLAGALRAPAPSHRRGAVLTPRRLHLEVSKSLSLSLSREKLENLPPRRARESLESLKTRHFRSSLSVSRERLRILSNPSEEFRFVQKRSRRFCPLLKSLSRLSGCRWRRAAGARCRSWTCGAARC